MDQHKLLNTKYTKGISYLAIFGGLLGVFQIIWSMVETKQYSHLSYYLIMGLNYFGFEGGKKLLKKELVGLKLLAIFFGFQIIAVTAPPYYFNFIYGIGLNIDFKISEYFIRINFYALVLFILILELFWEYKCLTKDSSVIAPDSN